MTETGNERNGCRMWSEQFGGFPRLGTVRTLRRFKREPADSRKEVHLCRSYTASLARSSAILKSFPIPIVTGQITVRSAKRIVRCGRTAEFALPYLRFGVVVIALFLVARLLFGLTL